MYDLNFELERLESMCHAQLLNNYCEYRKYVTFSKVSLDVYLDYVEKALKKMKGNYHGI